MNSDLYYKMVRPDESLSDYVDSFWWLQNNSDQEKEVIILPDGRVDLSFSSSVTEVFHVTLLGFETQYGEATIPPHSMVFTISFKPLAVEYVFHSTIAGLVDNAQSLPNDFWNFSRDDLNDFELFCQKASRKIQLQLPGEADSRKLELFKLIHSSNGSLTVKELSQKVFWSSRQINRYFNQQFGISLKAYCNILRFRASFQHIKEGKLFPKQNFTDQSHFIREVKKLSGVSPKELNKNQNDRFIQFSTLSKK